MATNCPACSEALPADAKFCLKCGAPTAGSGDWAGGVPPPPAPPSKGMSTTTIVLIVVGCVFLCGIPGIAIVAAIAIPNLLAAKLSANETAAIATLRNLTSAQAMTQGSGKIDVDGDGIGEFGTFLEMTGTVPLRAGKGPGPRLSPSYLSQSLSGVQPSGIVTKSGYVYVIYLPDASGKGWVHETGPSGTLTGPVNVDAAETHWCAYAWPIARGNTGNRCFFVNQEGDVLQSANDVARHQGVTVPVPPESALCRGNPAVGTVGADGDLWKVTN